MGFQPAKAKAGPLAAALLLVLSGCGPDPTVARTDVNTEPTVPVMAIATPEAKPEATPEFPDLQAELTDDRFTKTHSPLAGFDFKNHSYPLPRGWHERDGNEITLEDGLRPRESDEKIGLSYVTTRYLDVTGDGIDEAFVILKIETGGGAIPQLVYVFGWTEDDPKLLWNFRTGDRADGGLKDIRSENGQVLIELYGQDRYMLGEVETGKITGDDVQLCCPTYFTRSFYKWNGRHFLRQGKRLTFSVENPTAPPIENMGDIVNSQFQNKKSK
jgi:hypothetical protein